ncbi:MAG TPA: protein-methionine-sulfoxide reductase catalytic subunit MsrP [Steroidobacteraceae bacterium]
MSTRPPHIAPSQITPRERYLNRRSVLAGSVAVAAGAALGGRGSLLPGARAADAPAKLPFTRNAAYAVAEPQTSFEDVTSYNNFYEFGTDKADPKANAQKFRTHPWSVTIGGEAEVTGRYTLEDILKPHPLEERIYRFRCVEAWSMVIPWVGFPLGALLQRFKPTSRAKFVRFTTLYDPQQMPGQRVAVLRWPYVEGLRIDEAMHPLALLVVGLYGQTLPNQDGAPLRLMLPWKYGFKSIKSIVRIDFTPSAPETTWNNAVPNEYGFFANVNPAVDHPRWSQATERRIGARLFAERRPTLPFNGYAEQVAGLYRGMDLRRYF